ncbi:hypothetical protein ACLMJK_000639 [Lecanora helva]
MSVTSVGGSSEIYIYIYTALHTFDPEYAFLVGELPSPRWVGVTGHGSLRQLSIEPLLGQPAYYDAAPAVATVQQSVVADALTETGELWDAASINMSNTGHGNILKQQYVVHSIKHDYYQPYVITSCGRDDINGAQDESAIAFPVPPFVQANLMLNQSGYNDDIVKSEYGGKIRPMFSYNDSGISKQQILSLPGSKAEYRLKWVELPQDPFNGSAIGAVILPPLSATTPSQDILVCTLGSGWGLSTMNTSTFDYGTQFTTSLINTPSLVSKDLPIPNVGPRFVTEQPKADVIADSHVIGFSLPSFPEKPIIVTEPWANYLNPYLPALNTTVINAIMSTYVPAEQYSSGPNRLQINAADMALSGLLANGLSSIGANGRPQGTLKTTPKPGGSDEVDANYWFSGKGDMFIVDPEESKDWVSFRVETYINGFAYSVRGLAPKVAIGFLLAYCIITLSHVVYAGISGVSSTCWDSIGEVTALAMNSTPTILLRNTCAGIMELKIYRLPVRVFAFRDAEGEGEHLELVFGNVDEKNVNGTPIKPNRPYGTLPGMVKAEKIE